MTLSLTSDIESILAADVTEHPLFTSLTALKYYSTFVFLNRMQVDDVLDITVEVFDENVNTVAELRIYDSQTFKGVQSNPAIFIPFVPAEDGYVVTVTKTSTTNNLDIGWSRYET